MEIKGIIELVVENEITLYIEPDRPYNIRKVNEICDGKIKRTAYVYSSYTGCSIKHMDPESPFYLGRTIQEAKKKILKSEIEEGSTLNPEEKERWTELLSELE